MSSDSGLWERIDRRTTLKGIATAIGIAGLGGEAAANPGKGRRNGNGNGDGNGGAPPSGASDCDFVVDNEDDENYDSIQAAVDDAEEGDTICVAPGGTYEERVVIDTDDLTIKKLDVPDQTPDPVVDADGRENAFFGDGVSGVTISQFEVKNATKGIVFVNSEDITLEGIEAHDNDNDGTTFWQTHDSVVRDSHAHDNGDNGFYANGNNNTVKDSVAHHNSDQGIDMSNDYDGEENFGGATVENCTAHHNHNGGIELQDDDGDATLNNNHTYDNDFKSRREENNDGDDEKGLPIPDASGLVINNTSSIEEAVGNDFQDGIAVNGVDTDP